MLSKKQMGPDCRIALLCHPPHSSVHKNLGPFTRLLRACLRRNVTTIIVAPQEEISGLPGAAEILPGAGAGLVQG